MSHTCLCSFRQFQTVLNHSLITELFLEDIVMKKIYLALIFSLMYMQSTKYKVIQNYHTSFKIKHHGTNDNYKADYDLKSGLH